MRTAEAAALDALRGCRDAAERLAGTVAPDELLQLLVDELDELVDLAEGPGPGGEQLIVHVCSDLAIELSSLGAMVARWKAAHAPAVASHAEELHTMLTSASTLAASVLPDDHAKLHAATAALDRLVVTAALLDDDDLLADALEVRRLVTGILADVG